MSGVADVRLLEPRRVGDAVEVAAELTWPWRVSQALHGGRRRRVWIRVPVDADPTPVAAADAFLLGTFFSAMRFASVLRVHGVVSQGLAANLARLAPLWCDRRPDRYREVEIRADGEEAAAAREGPSILCFSGGLDSAYSLQKHARSGAQAGTPPLYAALMLQGADIPVGEDAAFDVAFGKARRIAASRGVPLLRASTNLRVVRQNWEHSWPATLAAVMGLFRSRCARGLIAIAYTVGEGLRWGPQEVTDPSLVAGAAFPVAGDGYEVDRFEKMMAVRDWTEALEDIRVCYRPGSWTGNCGTCLKCLLFGFYAQVACGRPAPCLPRALGVDDARAMLAVGHRNLTLRILQLVRHARALGYSAPWLDVFEAALPGTESDTLLTIA